VTTRRKALLTAHVLGSVATAGAVVVTFVLLASLPLAPHGPLSRWAPRLGSLCVYGVDVPLLAAALVTGVTSALTSPWGLFRHGWVTKKLVLTLANVVIAAAVVGPSTAELATPGAGRLVVFGGLAAQLLLLTLTAALSVYKPKGRVGGRRAGPVGPAVRREVKA